MTHNCIANGRSVIQQNIVYKVKGPPEPDWPLENGYVMDIEGEPALVPFGRVNLETGLADGIIGGHVFYSLHYDHRDESKTHQFGFGLQF